MPEILPKSGIEELIEKAGSQQAVADVCGVKQQAVAQWVARGFVPLSRAVELEAQFGIERKRLVDPRLVSLLS